MTPGGWPRASLTDEKSRRVGLPIFLLVLVVLVAVSWDDISQPRYEHGDFAANSILIDKAMTLDLLHGNYSRTGFYHPGPALLYVQATSQFLFYELLGLVPTPYNAHLLGVLALNAAMLALAGRTLQRRTGSYWPAGLLLLTAFAYSLQFDSPGLGSLLSSTWMPHVYVWPYLLLLVSAASVAAGHAEELWVFALASGLLVHGHVSFVLPVLALSVLVIAFWVWTHRGSWLRAIPPSHRIATAIVLGLFVLPLAVQLIIEFPGQFGSYVSYLRETDLPPRGLGTVVGYVAQFWGFGTAWPFLIPTLALGVVASTYFAAPGSGREFNTAMIWTGVVATSTTAIYTFSGVDDFTYTYLALFYVAVPIIAWTVLGANLFERWIRERPLWTAGVTVLAGALWIVVVIQPASGSLYDGSDVGIAYQAMDQLLGPEEPVAFSFTQHDDWAVTVGVLQQARRDGREACVRVGPGIFEVIFTVDNLCPEIEAPRAEALITALNEAPTPGASILFDGDNYDIWRVDD